MYRPIRAALVLVVAGGWAGVPQAAADNPVCTQTWCAFLTPSRNLSCEIDYRRGSGIPDETYCQTNSPPQSVHMSSDGSFKPCTGDSCLGNPGQGTATLAYGQAAVSAPSTVGRRPAESPARSRRAAASPFPVRGLPPSARAIGRNRDQPRTGKRRSRPSWSSAHCITERTWASTSSTSASSPNCATTSIGSST